MCGCKKGKRVAASTGKNVGKPVKIIAGPYQGRTGVITGTPQAGTYSVRLATGGEKNFYTSFVQII